MSEEKSLKLYEDSAVGAIELKTVTQVVDVLRATLQGGSEMPKEVLGAIAFDSMLTGTMPGREIHYFWYKDKKTGKMKLGKSDDFKLLIRWANEKEQLMSGDPAATIKEKYRFLTDEERATDKVAQNDTAVFCTIISDRDKKEIRGWIDTGFSPQEALDLVGTTAIGVVKANDTKIPTGWSPGQKARKLAQKACIRARYGQPSMDELAAMRRRWAKVATDEDWQEIPESMQGLPLEAQARYANLVAISKKKQPEVSPDERRARMKARTDLLRGPVEEAGIGDEPEQDCHMEVLEDERAPTDEELAKEKTRVKWLEKWAEEVMSLVPFYRDRTEVYDAMYHITDGIDPEEWPLDDTHLDDLRQFASSQADARADEETEVEQDKLL